MILLDRQHTYMLLNGNEQAAATAKKGRILTHSMCLLMYRNKKKVIFMNSLLTSFG